jgi:hypothetical protein
MNIEDYFFTVAEQDIALFDDTPWTNKINGYKAIVAPGENKDQVISVVKDTYKLIPNKLLIEPFMNQVSRLGVRWKLDPSHSFCQLNRMRLQITFPDILLHDEDSEIPLSVFLHNSYDLTESVRLFWGAIRSICSNGMVFGNILGTYYAKHTQGFAFEKFYDEFGNASDKISKVQQRIHALQESPVETQLMEQLQKQLGKRRMEEITFTDKLPDKTQWELLNDITYFISHELEKPKRADFQMKVSKAFAL